MYETFFGLRERPFDLSPSPRFLVLTPPHREVLANLQHGIGAEKGLTLLVGEPGSGKTTVIRAAIASLPAHVHAIHLSNPALTLEEFTETIARHFGLSERAALSKAVMLSELEVSLSDRRRRGETAVLILDEAQVMPTPLLEEVRLLANIGSNETKLLSIVLAGQPELADRLKEPGLRQLKQCAALRCNIRPLEQEETETYIAGRMQTAGGHAERAFTREAVILIHNASRGLPRIINVLADNALLGAFAEGRALVDADGVRRVCRDFDLDPGVVPGTYFGQDSAPAANAEPGAPLLGGDVSDVPAPVAVEGLASTGGRRRQSARLYVAAAVGMLIGFSAIAAVVLGLDRTGSAEPVQHTAVAEPGLGANSSAPTTPMSTSSTEIEGSAGDLRRVDTPPSSPQAQSERPDSASVTEPSTSLPLVLASAALSSATPQVQVPVPPSLTVGSAAAALPAVRLQEPAVLSLNAPSGSVAPASRPAVPSPSADAPIQAVVEQYRRAFSALSASEVASFWPSVNQRNLQRAFDQLDSQQIQFDACVVSTSGGDHAQVSCGGSATFVPKIGSRTPRVEARRWTFQMSRVNSAWRIDQVESR